MSKKARKARCYCGGKIRPGDKRCPRCDRVTTKGLNAGLRKAVAAQAGAAFLVKAAGGPRVACAPGWCQSRPGGNCCVRCGGPMPGVPVPPMGTANKSAFSREFWQRELGNSPDPALRELLQKMLYQGGT